MTQDKISLLLKGYWVDSFPSGRQFMIESIEKISFDTKKLQKIARRKNKYSTIYDYRVSTRTIWDGIDRVSGIIQYFPASSP